MKARLVVLGAALVVTATSLAWSPDATAHDSGRHVMVDMQDDCDPVSFNAVLGDGACVGDGHTTFDELVDDLVTRGESGKWRMHPRKFHVARGSDVMIGNDGGEFHTFTEVADFGAGCVPELNDLLGLDGPPAADCGLAFTDPATALPPGASGTIHTAGMRMGIHKFECMIHPWMHATMRVTRD